jgi:hypothetical protein
MFFFCYRDISVVVIVLQKELRAVTVVTNINNNISRTNKLRKTNYL